MSLREDCKCWRTRESDFDESAMCSWSFMSMGLAKRESGSRTVDKLSKSLGWRLGQ